MRLLCIVLLLPLVKAGLREVSQEERDVACQGKWSGACPLYLPEGVYLPSKPAAETIKSLVESNKRWIALVGDSLIRGVFWSLARYIGDDSKDVLAGIRYNTSNYHNSRALCCSLRGCSISVATDRGYGTIISQTEMWMEPETMCVTWIWQPHADERLANILLRLYRHSGPNITVLNQGLHGLVSLTAAKNDLKGMEASSALCRAKAWPCVLQTLARTNYTAEQASTRRHVRTNGNIERHNAALCKIWHGFPVADAWDITSDERVYQTITRDKIHYNQDSLSSILAQVYLHMLSR